MATPQAVIDVLNTATANAAAKNEVIKAQSAQIADLQAQLVAAQTAPVAPSFTEADLDPVMIAAEAVAEAVK